MLTGIRESWGQLFVVTRKAIRVGFTDRTVTTSDCDGNALNGHDCMRFTSSVVRSPPRANREEAMRFITEAARVTVFPGRHKDLVIISIAESLPRSENK